MNEFIMQLTILLAAATVALFIIAGLIWLFACHGIDRLRHPEEWEDEGKSGEQIIYRLLVDKIHVPESQILRNVYVPTEDGKTSEIDILAVSKKGLLVFECKNYAGNIYGDAKRNKWIQYLGKKKSYFYNPFMQNRTHVKHLKKYLEAYGDVSAIPMVSTISRGKWEVKNCGSEDYLLGYNTHLKDILSNTPDSDLIGRHFKALMAKLQPLSRPGDSIREEHIKQIKLNK